MDPPFRSDVDPSEIAVAYGRRSLPKLIDLLNNKSLPPASVVEVRRHLCVCRGSYCCYAQTLRHVNDLLPHQETKIEWMQLGGTEAIVSHFDGSDVAVVSGVTRALSQLAVIPQGREKLLALQCVGTFQYYTVFRSRL